MPWNK